MELFSLREWIANNIGYKFFGCFYNKSQQHLFNFIESKIPAEFLGKNISDLGCGDGNNTLRIKKIFKAKGIVGYEQNEHLIKRAQSKGLKVQKTDLNWKFPKGEMATFIFALHHLKDKKRALELARQRFKYLFLCEPENDLFHKLLDAGSPLKKEEWVDLFNQVLKKYQIYFYRRNLLVFYVNDKIKT